MADPIEVEAPDDTGSQTAKRYEYQTHVAVGVVLEMLAGAPVQHVTCEHIEDVTVARRGPGAGLLWDFQQVKTRDDPSPWRLADVLDKGPLESLWRTHQTLNDHSLTYQLTAALEGDISAKDPLLRLLARGEGAHDRGCLSRVAVRLGADPEAVAVFLKLIRVRTLPRRGDIELRYAAALGELTRPDISQGALKALYSEIVGIVGRAMVGQHGPRWAEWLGLPEPVGWNRSKRIDHASLAPFRQRLERPDLEAMFQCSQERMVNRWVAAGVPPAMALNFAGNPLIGAPQRGMAVLPRHGTFVIEGDYGSGKSLIAERYHLADIDAARVDSAAPLPVYLTAGQVHESLSKAVTAAALRVGDPKTHAVSVVLDGLDEPGLARGYQLLVQARTLTAVNPEWRVLATTRPGLDLYEQERRVAPLLTHDEAAVLIGQLGGQAGVVRQTTAEVRDALRRPLFALIAAELSRNDEQLPNQSVAFLEALARTAIRRARGPEGEVRHYLLRLAAATVSGGGRALVADVGDEGVADALLDTRLVVRQGRCLAFALPVLEQYFAGQAALRGWVPSGTLGDPTLLGKWRYALALAVASCSWEQTQELVAPLVASYPGVAAWVVREAIPFPRGDPNAPHVASDAAAQRLKGTWEAWMAALQPVSHRMFGYRPLDLVVDAQLDGPTLSAQLLQRDEGAVPALSVPFTKRYARENEDRRVTPVRTFHGTVAVDYGAWPWQWPLTQIESALDWVCEAQVLRVSDCPSYDAERTWAIGKALLGQYATNHTPLPAEQVLGALRQHLRRFKPTVPPIRSTIKGVDTTGEELIRLADQLDGGRWVRSDGSIHRPYELPDCDRMYVDWIWEHYSPVRLRLLTEQVLTAALEIYTCLVEQWFPALRPNLGLASIMPVCIDGNLLASRASGYDQAPTLHVRLEPRVQHANRVNLRLVTADDLQTYQPKFDLGTRVVRPLENGSWSRPYTAVVESEPQVFRDTPAIDYAYEWLHQDLAHLHLARRRPWDAGL
ncbi:dsDNA nuclease domain-containing protein [Streptomyces sp. NPDC048270]|uniref:dsDNA nuclease domain-containing protein n=1 Tax=Streptomyces sp. NPDC048270 TaxID=3154615 RepID=UPI00340BACD7